MESHVLTCGSCSYIEFIGGYFYSISYDELVGSVCGLADDGVIIDTFIGVRPSILEMGSRGKWTITIQYSAEKDLYMVHMVITSHTE